MPTDKTEKPSFVCEVCTKPYKSKQGLKKHKCVKPVVKRECDLCERSFKTESGLLNHKCKHRLRIEENKYPGPRIGFAAYQRFYSRTMSKTMNYKEKTLVDFVKSTYYNEFIKFGNFIVDVNMKGYMKYIDHLITYSVPLKEWNNEANLKIYNRNIIRSEMFDSAVERSLNTMTSWATKNNDQWNNYFKYNGKLNILNDIKMARISPWVLYNCDTGKEFLSKLDSADIKHIFDVIDASYWGSKFSRYPVEVDNITEIFKGQL